MTTSHALRLAAALCLVATTARAAPPARDRAEYRRRPLDPVLEQMKARNKADDKRRDKASGQIVGAEKQRQEREKKAERRLLFDLAGVQIPASPGAFAQLYHHPPVAQYLTGTCWSYAATSMLESEVFRLTGRKIKLSEQHTVYHEYLEKVRRWLRKRGHSALGEGSESNAVTRIYKQYGAVPASAYPGVTAKDGRHDHSQIFKRIEQYLGHVKATGLWDEPIVLATVRAILDAQMGPPPAQFTFEGATHTPQSFLRAVLKLDPDAYVEIMSTTKIPFWTIGEFEVPDNWWRSRDYHNVPLEEFYGLIKGALRAGYTVAIGGDVSEPGRNGFKDAAVIPSYDLPQEAIDQEAREYRIASGITTDDHGMHVVGFVRHADRDWFLVKDSGRSARWGKPAAHGYYYFRDDYVRLKMLTATIHRDVLGSLARRFRPAPQATP